MNKGQTMEGITAELLEDCAQLVKANSIQGLLSSLSVGLSCRNHKLAILGTFWRHVFAGGRSFCIFGRLVTSI
jgi:hypothetical protein